MFNFKLTDSGSEAIPLAATLLDDEGNPVGTVMLFDMPDEMIGQTFTVFAGDRVTNRQDTTILWLKHGQGHILYLRPSLSLAIMRHGDVVESWKKTR